MSFIKIHKSRGHTYYEEVESYRDDNGKMQHRVLRNFGREAPKELNGVPLGFKCAKLTEGKRVQVHSVKFGMEDFLRQIGIVKEMRKKYALVIFDNPIRVRKDWLLPFDMLGNIKHERG